MNVVINERYAVISDSNGQNKVVSLLDFYQALGAQLDSAEAFDEFLLPHGVIQFKRSKKELELVCYYPSVRKTIQFDTKLELKEYSIPFPNVLIKFKLSASSEDSYRVDSVGYYATDKAPADLKIPSEGLSRNLSERIWTLPLPNMFEGGRMCYGRNSVQVQFSKNLRGLGYYYRVLTDSPFNSDLYIHELSRGSNRNPLEWIEFLSECEEFPYNALVE